MTTTKSTCTQKDLPILREALLLLSYPTIPGAGHRAVSKVGTDQKNKLRTLL